jgi:hypothetical protein
MPLHWPDRLERTLVAALALAALAVPFWSTWLAALAGAATVAACRAVSAPARLPRSAAKGAPTPILSPRVRA